MPPCGLAVPTRILSVFFFLICTYRPPRPPFAGGGIRG